MALSPLQRLGLGIGDAEGLRRHPFHLLFPKRLIAEVRADGGDGIDGVIFHRVIAGFMIQGGDPNGVGTGGPGYHIKGEFAANGVKNDLKHTRGVLSMARAQHPDSAGSQFFVMHADADYLDGQYAAFGKVTEGMDVVDEIAAVPTDMRDRPREPQVMEKVTVETFGTEYPEPKKTR